MTFARRTAVASEVDTSIVVHEEVSYSSSSPSSSSFKRRHQRASLSSWRSSCNSIAAATIVVILLTICVFHRYRQSQNWDPFLSSSYPQDSSIGTPTATGTTTTTVRKIKSVVKKSSGQNWKAWTVDDDILFADQTGGASCRWLNYTSIYSPQSGSIPICAHPHPDIISKAIARFGNWGDCAAVSRQWNNDGDGDGGGGKHVESMTKTIYLEIGANLGSCVFEMLLSSNPEVEILAFEPHPRNLFALTSSLKANPALGKRVTVFPVALGTKSGETVRLSLQKVVNKQNAVNFGSSFVTQEGDIDSEIADQQVEYARATMERLDDIVVVSSTSAQVRLAKLDVQGFECNILDSMFPNIIPDIIVTELENESLKRNGCSSAKLIQRLSQSNYEPKWYRFSGILESLPADGRDAIVVALQRSTTT